MIKFLDIKFALLILSYLLVGNFLADNRIDMSKQVSKFGNTIIIAHRGASYIAPENTRASVKLAWELGAEAAEVDIRLTADNKIVVIHDATTRRTGNMNKTILKSSYNELSNIDVGSFKSDNYTDERIPLLDQLLDEIPDGKILFIEIKSGTEILKPLKELIYNKQFTSKLIIIAFDFETICKAKQIMPDIPAYWLLSSIQPRGIKKIIKKVKNNGLNGIDINYRSVSNKLMRKLKKENLTCYTWTVNDPETAAKLISLEIDGITTDRPLWLKEQIRKLE